MSSFLFVTDLDNTLVGDDAALAALNDRLSWHRQEYGTLLVYATGRSQALYQELRVQKGLLEPDVLILSVGTQIYRQSSTAPDPAWTEQLNQNWDQAAVRAIAAQFSDLTPQPTSEQGDFKASYYLDAQAAEVVLPQLEAALRSKGLDAKLIYSSHIDLDIVPGQGNKGAAVMFLQHSLGLSKTQTVVCGDSGNDLSMFMTQAARGIIVGNAQPELLDWHYENPSADRYLAQAHCAGGILEGLSYFGFLN